VVGVNRRQRFTHVFPTFTAWLAAVTVYGKMPTILAASGAVFTLTARHVADLIKSAVYVVSSCRCAWHFFPFAVGPAPLGRLADSYVQNVTRIESPVKFRNALYVGNVTGRWGKARRWNAETAPAERRN
jgi:hypothetical protein